MSLTPQEFQAATKLILDAKKILITPHANVDPDGLGSALACYSLFTAIGKDCTVICPDSPPEALKFLPKYESLITKVPLEQQFVITIDCSSGIELDSLKYGIEDKKVNIVIVPKHGRIEQKHISLLNAGTSYDLILVVDTAELSLLGSVYSDHQQLFQTTPILNVDHHVSNTKFGNTHLIDSTCASATEVLYSWFSQVPDWSKRLTPDIATLLLTGLITDTRSFQNPNTTPRSLEVGATLLDLGARQQEIIQHVYKTKPLTTLRIWGRALNRIQIDEDARIVWSFVSKEDLTEMGAQSKETHGILDELLSTVPDSDVYILFTEMEDNLGFKASVRSSASVDCNRLVGTLFGGGGHARAAGFKVKGYSNFQVAVVEAVQKITSELTRLKGEGKTSDSRKSSLQTDSEVKAKNLEEASKSSPSYLQAPTPQERIDIVKRLSGQGEK